MKTILVAVDGSLNTERVLQVLEHLRLQSTTKVVLTYVISTVQPDSEAAADRPHLEAEATVEQRLRTYEASLPYQAEVEIVRGDPAEEIVRLANIHQADLIVIGNRGFTGLKRILQGSVSAQVVAEAHCSVFVVKDSKRQ
ncbi:MAG: universal stress protein [Microcoleaceae cyanobacterium]